MTTEIREIKQGLQEQGADEQIEYTLTTTPWGTSPTSTSATIWSHDPTTDVYTNVTATNMSGSTSVSGDVITLPIVKSLVAGTLYRVEVQFTSGNSIFEPFGKILGKR